MGRWTVDDVPAQDGRTALVTGANSGIGLQSALALAGAGARVLMACRDPARGEAAAARVRQEGGRAEYVPLDLADLVSVRRLAAAVGNDGLDILVNNAGIMAVPARSTTAQGAELQMGVNHLGHFALTGLLMPALSARPGARVVTVSSVAHRKGRIAERPLHPDGAYSPWQAYRDSKLANLVFALELERRARAAGADLLSMACHPGLAATNLPTAGPRLGGGRLRALALSALFRLRGQTDAGGALPGLYAATSPEAVGGGYYGPDGRGGLTGWPAPAVPAPQALDPEAARRLWDASEEFTGVAFAFTPC